MRYALALEYDGSAFYGWQRQRQSPTAQEVLEVALAKVANQPCKTYAAGRTDSGVHACAQIIHFDSDAQRDERSWILGLNTHLPDTASVLWVKPVSDQFHARFSAQSRSYCYRIYNHRVRPSLLRHFCTWSRRPLDAEAMNNAAQYLMGEHDFSSFRASGCQAHSPMRKISQIDVVRKQEWITLHVTANAFLYHMVRNIAGSLMHIGRGEQCEQWMMETLLAKDRKVAGVTAPPNGLFFLSASYPKHFNLPSIETTISSLSGLI